MQRDAVPGEALHMRHMGIVIHVRAVIPLLLDDSEDSGRRLAFGGAGRDWRAQDPAFGVVERDPLGLSRHDGHDRLAGLALRRFLGGLRAARLSLGGSGGGHRQHGHCGKHCRDGRVPKPHLCAARESNYHSMVWFERLWDACRCRVRSRFIGQCRNLAEFRRCQRQICDDGRRVSLLSFFDDHLEGTASSYAPGFRQVGGFGVADLKLGRVASRTTIAATELVSNATWRDRALGGREG